MDPGTGSRVKRKTTAAAARDSRGEGYQSPEEVGSELEDGVQEEPDGVLVGIETVEVGVGQAGASEDDVEAVLRAVAAGTELRVEAADLGAVEDAERSLAEAAAVAEDAAGAHGVGETEDDAVAGGADAGGLGRDSEAAQRGDNPGAFGSGREHGR